MLGGLLSRYGDSISNDCVFWRLSACDYPGQLLHAVTFGIHHSASMSLIQRWFPAQAQARGQAFYTMASYGLGGSIGGIAAGWLWEAVSPEFSFIAAAGAAGLGAVVAVSGLRAARGFAGHN